MARNEGPPDWMSEKYSERDTYSIHASERAESVAFPRSVITGVKIIASLMLLNTCIGAAFVIVSLFPPAGTETGFGTVITADDYFSLGRILMALVLGILLAVGVWKIVETSD